MAHQGDRIENPATGMVLTFGRTADETGGQLTEMEARYRPGSAVPVDHYHPRQEERFEVLAGRMRVRVSGVERDLEAGEVLTIPAGTPHAMWNKGLDEARVNWQTLPALKTEPFHETICALAQAGRISAGGRPDLLQAAMLLAEYRDEFRPTRPADWVQRLLIAVLAPLGTLLGRRGHYPYPTSQPTAE